jgi:hypothetical protein
LIRNTKSALLTSFVVKIETTPCFEKGYAGLSKQPRWVLSGKWGMRERSDFGRNSGLIVVVLQFNFGEFTLLLMNKGRQ